MIDNTTSNENSRRKFIKSLGKLGVGASILTTTPSALTAHTFDDDNNTERKASNNIAKPIVLNILQTTDVHCQVHPHDELFWENNQAVFRKTGGYAHLETYLKNERKKYTNTFLIDTGDMFQGSELSVKTTGKAIAPILNALNYDLYLPGNWEVIYYKKTCKRCWAH